MITGAHAILYSTDADADRAFLRDVLGLPHVDVGEGWLVFALPPAEVAVHPGNANDVHELYLMCDDVDAFVASMAERLVACGPVEDRGWGLLTEVTLPGGSKLGVYEPQHARPRGVAAPPRRKRAVRNASRAEKKSPARKATRKSSAKDAKRPKRRR